jgi:pimeloyl-ACP methyl ester carboxylesterase
VPDTHREWNRVLALLDRTDVITPDLPGFGSPVPDGFGATKEEYVDWLVRELEAVGEPVDLVGHDWGALISERVLELRPDLLRTIAFGGCAIDPSYTWHDTAQMWQTPEVGEQVVAAMTPEVLATGLPGTGIPADVAAEIGTHIDDTMRACILSLYRSAVNVWTEWVLPSPSPVPTLVISGAEDPYIGPAHHKCAAERTGAELLELDCNHWWPLERPAEVAAALERLWASA